MALFDVLEMVQTDLFGAGVTKEGHRAIIIAIVLQHQSKYSEVRFVPPVTAGGSVKLLLAV